MKKIFAVAVLLMSFASVAFADGSDLPPMKSLKHPKVTAIQLTDGSDLPPVRTKPAKPPVRNAAA